MTDSSSLLARAVRLWDRLSAALDALQPAAALAARVYVGQVFFLSGLTKIRDWDTTLALFADEYKVPLLPTALAAFMGTAGELVLPVLLVLGLGGRFAALGLSVVNVVAVLSLQEIAPAALQQHVFWGALLAGIAVYGPGKWSAERLVWPRLQGAATLPVTS
ncbi:DoxX family protein [Caenimonas sedimenti]|uniref:DoxX family protein n=1 Tax=Caenimonas sedimenti TaxID=2596921 RepID=A0A562ZRY2_9BURK|nr:DoxX family protein [Caenimonas sedimenti]TWO71167.1 DoxX family protein [Caenimonas sedimenti]